MPDLSFHEDCERRLGLLLRECAGRRDAEFRAAARRHDLVEAWIVIADRRQVTVRRLSWACTVLAFTLAVGAVAALVSLWPTGCKP